MNERPICDDFPQRLDDLAAGLLSAEERDRLADHAAACPGCAVLWRVHRHLAESSAHDLETAVPDELVDGMWSAVDAGSRGASGAWPSPARRVRPAGRRWLAPSLAAAVLVLALVSGFLYGRLRAVRGENRELAGRLREQEAFLSGMDLMAARYAGSSATFAAAADRGEGTSRMTAGRLVALLGTLPAETVVLAPGRAAELLDAHPLWRGLPRRLGVRDFDARDGVQADEVIRIIETLDPDPDATISRARLRDFLPAGRIPSAPADGAAREEVGDHD